ncbi:metal-dependent hydrolase [Streptomyces sp. Ru73]|uniref:M48 metallopeptidase family protein n=1 Tax=Streptomyces sp. Ru73 TaxID=2080748 RepID=UPI000CDD4195|nr:M48 family metallopeptidase [Streptomyces sp. Ru73]POX39960.1 metal-dependent hydrolase [Streptomyces sp. Ru73]
MPADPLHRAAAPQRRSDASPQSSGSTTSAVEVRRSSRRRRTVSAYREGDRTVVLIPARMSEAEERRWVTVMLDKLAAQESKRILGDDELAERAERLSGQYLGGRARPASVRWVTNQNTRWGSCTPAEGSIRLSHRLQGMPEYVIDYVLLHELAHLLVPGHGAGFWELLTAYPRTERARGYLEGVVAAGRLPHLPAARSE